MSIPEKTQVEILNRQREDSSEQKKNNKLRSRHKEKGLVGTHCSSIRFFLVSVRHI
jgi:hypothetical protein